MTYGGVYDLGEQDGGDHRSDSDLPQSATVARTIAGFAIDAYALARDAADPQGGLDEMFPMIEAAWEVTGPSRCA